MSRFGIDDSSRRRKSALILFLTFYALRFTSHAQDAPTLISELGCANCHTDLPFKSTLRERTPDLSPAGLRYSAPWLFEFLQNPVQVRRHLGRARMPAFHLTAEESLALTAFLQTQTNTTGEWPPVPAAVRAPPSGPPAVATVAEFQAVMNTGLLCFTCHTLDGKGGPIGVELGNISYRLKREWMMHYLVAPEMFGVPHTTMPPQFYVLDKNKTFQELTDNPARKIQVIVDHLFSLNAPKRNLLDQKYNAARTQFPNATPEHGRNLFNALHCAECHRTAEPPAAGLIAPPLANAHARSKPAWLLSYLKKPHALRPAGYRPGDGSRMPDFRLTDSEAAPLANFLSTERGQLVPAQTPTFHPRQLSAFAKRKADLLLTEKLSCLGCHRLGDKGGRIGPDLTQAPARLQPSYVFRMITDPRATHTNTIMPRIPMAREVAELITNYLLQHDHSSAQPEYLHLIDHAPPSSLYQSHCAPCHGRAGKGNGFNATFLPKQPTAHADSAYISKRPNDTLYDGIHSGGYILNKSHFMPAWGETLTNSQIKELVRYIRSLCQCEGPAWQ